MAHESAADLLLIDRSFVEHGRLFRPCGEERREFGLVVGKAGGPPFQCLMGRLRFLMHDGVENVLKGHGGIVIHG
jgi:hypothetical protein